MKSSENITNISIDLLIPNAYQPRKSFSEQSLNELAQSIKEYGILNPILVTEKNGKYVGMIHLHDIIKEGII